VSGSAVNGSALRGRTLTAVSAGIGQPSASRLLADRMIAATGRALAEAGVGVTPALVDLRDNARDVTSALLTGVPSAALAAAISTTTGSDGLIVVTPVFNASYSGLFKMFFDILDPDSLAGKPVLIGATGNTPRHSLVIEHAIRPMFGYLRSVVVPTGVYAAAQDWGGAGGPGAGADGADPDALDRRIRRAAGELAGLIAARPAAAPADPYADFTPMADLLGEA
jgi:FMN reductase